MLTPPIALFAYKRPNHLKLCLEAIGRAEEFCNRKFPLTIYCDAPCKEEDRKEVEATIAVAKSSGRVVICREKNLGFRNITEGIQELCDKHSNVIVIEDDVIIAPDFLAFMLASMEAYENDERVFMISGFMYHGMENYEKESFFLRSPFIWGWATWKRAWRHFTWEPEGWQTFLKNKKEKSEFDFYGSHPFSKGLEKTMTGRWNTWDAQWMFSHFSQGGLALYPSKSLVWNCGVGGGFHGSSKLDADPLSSKREFYLHGNYSIEDFQKPRVSKHLLLGKSFPISVECDKKAMHHLALIFLKERLQTGERKKWRLLLKVFLLKISLILSRA